MAQITMLTTLCGPHGNAFPGTVLEVSDKEAKQFLSPDPAKTLQINGKGDVEEVVLYSHRPFARQYNRELDSKAQRGLVKPVA